MGHGCPLSLYSDKRQCSSRERLIMMKRNLGVITRSKHQTEWAISCSLTDGSEKLNENNTAIKTLLWKAQVKMGDELERKLKSRELPVLFLSSRRNRRSWLKLRRAEWSRAALFFPRVLAFRLVTHVCHKTRFYTALSRTLLSSFSRSGTSKRRYFWPLVTKYNFVEDFKRRRTKLL